MCCTNFVSSSRTTECHVICSMWKKMQVDVLPAYFLLALTCKIHSKSTAHSVSFLEYFVCFFTLKFVIYQGIVWDLFCLIKRLKQKFLSFGYVPPNSQLLRQLVMSISDQGIKPGLCWSQMQPCTRAIIRGKTAEYGSSSSGTPGMWLPLWLPKIYNGAQCILPVSFPVDLLLPLLNAPPCGIPICSNWMSFDLMLVLYFQKQWYCKTWLKIQ